jgi:hypothetical protein
VTLTVAGRILLGAHDRDSVKSFVMMVVVLELVYVSFTIIVERMERRIMNYDELRLILWGKYCEMS